MIRESRMKKSDHAGEVSVMRKKFAWILLTVMCLVMTFETARAEMPDDPLVVPVYCFYSEFMKDHMWTASENERQYLINNYYTGKETYRFQRISGYVENIPTQFNIPVYRFWNQKTTDHFYTTSENEKNQLAQDLISGKDNYEYEGIAWYVPEKTGYPVYRFFDTEAFNHYYTSSEPLKEKLSQEYLEGKGTYRYEGIAWYWYE